MKNVKTFDMDGLSNYLRDCRNFRRDEAYRQKSIADAFFQGYEEAISNIQIILEASNYQVQNPKECPEDE